MAYNIDYDKDIIYNIDIDIHHKILIPTISAKQYDENARYLVFTVWDDGQPYVIPEGTTVMFCTTKPDLHGVANACEIINGKVVYKLTLQTTIVHGNFPAELRFYRTALGESKAYATPDFNIHIGKSALLDDTILSSDEVNVLTELIADATDSIAKMTSALTAESGRVSAENIRVTNENTRKTNETNRATAESSRVTVENARVTAENTRKTNETTRGTNETARQTAETGRVTVESARVTDENTRKSQETTRQTNETTRQSQETTRQNFYNAYKVLETYNNTKAYVVGNKVTYLGGHYQNILASTGVPPTYNTDNANWKCIGAKGADGTGVGDMLGNIYDTTNKKTDVFAYIDNKTITSTDTNLGLVKGNGNVEVRTDGAMWADPYKDKLSNASSTFLTSPTSDDALVHVKKIEGETVQVVTVTGKNILENLYKFGSKSGNYNLNGANLNWVKNSNGTITISGDVGTVGASINIWYWGNYITTYDPSKLLFIIKAGTYTLKDAYLLGFLNGEGVVTAQLPSTFTLTKDFYVVGVRNMGETNGVTLNKTYSPQLELGTTATTYEQYIPNSPSVEYPSPLKYAKDFALMSSGENIFDINGTAIKAPDITNVSINGDSISVTSNNTLAFSNIEFKYDIDLFKGKNIKLSHKTLTSSVGGTTHLVQLMYKVGTAPFYFPSSVQGTSINIPYNVTDVSVKVLTNNIPTAPSVVNTVTATGIQMEFVNKTDYDSYKGTDKINISFPFMSLPSGVKNSIELVNGVLNKVQRVKEVIFDGSSDENWGSNAPWDTSAPSLVHPTITINDWKVGQTNWMVNIMSKKYLTNGVSVISEECTYVNVVNNGFYLFLFGNRITGWSDSLSSSEKLALFKIWLASNPITIQYELATPIYTPIADIYLKSFKNLTNLFTNSEQQVTLTADFKSELWSRDYLQDEQLKSKFDVNNIIQTDTIGGTDKVPSAEVTKVLGVEIDTINSKLSNVRASVKDFGAKGDGVTDDTVAISTAISALPIGSILDFPMGSYLISGTGSQLILLNKNISLIGESARVKLLVKSTVGNATDVIRVNIPGEVRDLTIANITIAPQSGTPARHGIHFDVTNANQAIASTLVSRVSIAQLGSSAIKLTNPTNENGFFSNVIEKCFITGGLNLERCGDSVVIKENTVTGSGIGLEISAVAGACQVIFENNNVTTTSELIKAISAFQLKIINNQLEQVFNYTGTSGSMVHIVGSSGYPNIACEIIGNNINGNIPSIKPTNLIKVDYAEDTIIEGNYLQKGTGAAILITSNAKETKIRDNRWGYPIIAPSIDDSGIGTRNIIKNITLPSGWVNAAAYVEPASFIKSSDGDVSIMGSIIGTSNPPIVPDTLFYLPVGFRPSIDIYSPITIIRGETTISGYITIFAATGKVNLNGWAAIGNDNVLLRGVSFRATNIY